ncbi:MAG: hypothetical protein ACTHLR_03480 [Rhizomicrobium sp.]
MRALFVCLLVFMAGVASPAFSKGDTVVPVKADDDALIVPAGSPLHFRSFGAESVGEFDGAIELSGTWYYGNDPLNEGDTGANFYFVPDDASFARLPRFKQRSQPAYVFLTNAIDLLNAVASKSDQAKAEKKGATYISGKVAIWIDKFEAGIECDAPYFDAHFLRVAQPPSRVALANMPEEGC